MKNACLPDTRGAIHSTGMAASQVHAQTGVSPVPRKKRAAETARHGAARVASLGFELDFESMEKSPYRAAYQFPKLLWGKADAPGAIQHDVAVYVSPLGEGHFPNIILFEVTTLHGRRNRVRNGIEGGGTASAKIFGETARTRARAGENVVEDTGTGKSVVDVAFHHSDQSGLSTSAHWMSLDVVEQLGKLAVSDVCEQRGAIGEVMVDGHRRDADSGGDAAHADCFGSLGLENLQSDRGDMFGGSPLDSDFGDAHLYSVYYTPYSCKP